MAFLIASVLAVWMGRHFIRYMRKRQFGQSIREDGPESHKAKAGTPTMGGVFILGAVFSALLLVGNFMSTPFVMTGCVVFSYFLLGGLDDYLKILKKNSDGVSAKGKLLWQFATGLGISYYLVYSGVIDTKLYLPFFKDTFFDLGHLYPVFASFVIVGSSNAVNLTDGLDGLAIGPIITSAGALGVLAYLSGHAELSRYLFLPYIEGVGELLVLSSALIGAGLGFLWYNSYPAQVFMGDVGSLSLGGGLGTIAVVTKNEILFVLIGGIFVIEALSVILQVFSYKTRKKRIFKMAPIHHHFELLGWNETKVIVRFWIISVVLALISLATIKLR